MGKKEKISTIYLTIIIMGTLTIFKFILMIVSNGGFLSNLIWGVDDRKLFYDFWAHIRYCLLGGRNVYAVDTNACFPPLAYLFYSLMAAICRYDNTKDYNEIESSNSGIVILMMTYIVFAVVLVVVIQSLLDDINKKYINMYCILIMLSTIFSFAVYSGNISIGVCILLLAALYLRQKDGLICRELSLVLIAIASAFKIYPAVFGVLYLIEHRYKESVRLIIYGMITFFLPFAFFGGFGGIINFLNNAIAISGNVTGISLTGVLLKILCGFVPSDLAMGIASVVNYIYLIVSIFVVIRRKVDWKSYTILCGLFFLFNKEVGYYCLIYLLIGFVFFIRETSKLRADEIRTIDWIYTTLFSS